MKTCFLVYRLIGVDRELVKIFSTAEKAEEFIEVLEKLAKKVGDTIDYEYDEEEIE